MQNGEQQTHVHPEQCEACNVEQVPREGPPGRQPGRTGRAPHGCQPLDPPPAAGLLLLLLAPLRHKHLASAQQRAPLGCEGSTAQVCQQQLQPRAVAAPLHSRSAPAGTAGGLCAECGGTEARPLLPAEQQARRCC